MNVEVLPGSAHIRDHLIYKIHDKHFFRYALWQPQAICIVLGSSQTAETELFTERCLSDSVPVYKRRGGGGAVVLMPGILCLTFAFKSTLCLSPYFFFKEINTAIMHLLEQAFGVEDLSLTGISDIAIRDRKILGCSLFKSRQNFLYQGSLLVNPDPALIPYYLRHPSKEPDYRKNRVHADFITSLCESGYPLSVEQVHTALEDPLIAFFKSHIVDTP